jgi:hypothetical protein
LDSCALSLNDREQGGREEQDADKYDQSLESVNYETGCRHDDFLAQIKFAINDHHFKAERWQEIVGRCLRA